MGNEVLRRQGFGDVLIPYKVCRRRWEYQATYIRLGTKEYFLLSSLPQKTKCKHVPVRAIPKQALNELTLELEAIKLLQTEVTPELIAQVQCYASEVTLLQVIVNLPAQGCLTYCFIVIFRHNSNESSKSQKISKLKLFQSFYTDTCGMCIAVVFLIVQQLCIIFVGSLPHSLSTLGAYV